MKVDFHIHSLCSDGIYTVDELIPMLRENGIEIFSLTDHDTVDGIKAAKRLTENMMRFVSGIEFTCKEMRIPAIETSFSIHLLGYYYDEKDTRLLESLEVRKKKVVEVYDALCREITDMGYPVLRKDIPISCGNVLQLCDVEKAVRTGYPYAEETVFEKIGMYCSKLNDVNISVEKAVDLIHHAGGKAVWAHPFCVYKDFRKARLTRPEVEETVKQLKSAGIDGLEAYYLAFDGDDREWLRSVALREDLFFTAGSDFHGSMGRDLMGVQLETENERITEIRLD